MCGAERLVFDFVLSSIVVFVGMSKQNKKCIYTLEGNLVNILDVSWGPLWPGPHPTPIPHMLSRMTT
jgi:hypothetical protein